MQIKSKSDLDKLKESGLASIYPKKMKIIVQDATCGQASGAKEVLATIKEEAGDKAIVSEAGCIGFCQKEPLVDVVYPGKGKITYWGITPERAKELANTVLQGNIKKEWVLAKTLDDYVLVDDRQYSYVSGGKPSSELEEIPDITDIPFYKKQTKVALRNCGYIDPKNIDEYIARGGYYSICKILDELKPEQVIDIITKSGLRGRGGAGFPTGVKWNFCRKAKGSPKYIVCNADEGDPGAYMDRSILEGDAHSAIEGMLIGAYAIGATEGYVYVRNEYPHAIKNLQTAVEKAKEYGVLGDNIMGKDFSFNLNIVRGAGAFVCGEETALLASIEGSIGTPKSRPPYPAVKGLWGKPTNINNVKTWSNVPAIIAKGSDWFSKMGTDTSKGTMVFSLVGNINNTGLVEIPMGITLKEMVYEIGEGIPLDRKLKAVQTGGPSGGCIPESLAGLQVDYEKLTEAGSMMGSGGMVVMDDKTCMVNVAKYFLTFTQDESCGKCTPCREGTKRMLEILDNITEGRGNEDDLAFLDELAASIKDASLCGLGATAPNPVLTTIKYFKDEYLAHIRDKKCPAGVCKALITYSIDEKTCLQAGKGCGLCKKNCPENAITGQLKSAHKIDPAKCTKCGICDDVCNFNAVKVE